MPDAAITADVIVGYHTQSSYASVLIDIWSLDTSILGEICIYVKYTSTPGDDDTYQA